MNGFDFYFDPFWMAWHWKPAIEFLCTKNFLFFCFDIYTFINLYRYFNIFLNVTLKALRLFYNALNILLLLLSIIILLNTFFTHDKAAWSFLLLFRTKEWLRKSRASRVRQETSDREKLSPTIYPTVPKKKENSHGLSWKIWKCWKRVTVDSRWQLIKN